MYRIMLRSGPGTTTSVRWSKEFRSQVSGESLSKLRMSLWMSIPGHLADKT